MISISFRPFGLCALGLICGFGLMSCSVGPNYEAPKVTKPEAFKEAASKESGEATLGTHWWTVFNDPELNRLAQATLEANFTIRAAIARVDEARAATRGTRGGFFPSLSVDPTARRSRNLTGIDSNTGVATGSSTGNSFALPLDLSYEIDIWGRLHRETEYYKNNELASAADLALVQQTAVSTLAQSYFTIRLYDTQIGQYEKALGLFREQLSLTQSKQKAGLSLSTDVLQAQIQVDTASNQLIDVKRARAKQEHAIAILLGLPPSAFSLEAKESTLEIPIIPVGLPATLLTRRPDVAEAEHKLIAANALVGVAIADFLPTFSLTGSAGFETTKLESLTNWKNRVGSLGAGLSLPIFQGGKLTAALQQARASYRELVANYQTAVLIAYQETEDQLSDLKYLTEKTASLDQTLVSAREYYRLTQLQYKQGLSTYLQVIDANQSLLTNELSAAQAHTDRLNATVLLAKALGGGWVEGTALTPAAEEKQKAASK